MADWYFYISLAASIPFCLYIFPLKISLSTIAAGVALFYFLLKDSASNTRVSYLSPCPFFLPKDSGSDTRVT